MAAVDALTAYRAASFVARVLPERVGLVAASGVGRLLAVGMRGRRRMVARHLRRVHGPTMEGAALDRAVAAAFASYARYWFESFRLPGTPPEALDARMRVEGFEHIQRAATAGKGMIICMPHLGGWDFGGAWLAAQGYPATVVVEPLDPPALFEWFAGFRRTLGLEVVALGAEAGPATLRRLRVGGVVGLICDRDIAGNGAEVEFFGERTTIPAGPATLALRTGAALIPVAVYFEGASGHHAVVLPPVAVSRTGRLREDVARVSQLLVTDFEGLIRAAPEQWHLMQPNWPSDREPTERPV